MVAKALDGRKCIFIALQNGQQTNQFAQDDMLLVRSARTIYTKQSTVPHRDLPYQNMYPSWANPPKQTQIQHSYCTNMHNEGTKFMISFGCTINEGSPFERSVLRVGELVKTLVLNYFCPFIFPCSELTYFLSSDFDLLL